MFKHLQGKCPQCEEVSLFYVNFIILCMIIYVTNTDMQFSLNKILDLNNV